MNENQAATATPTSAGPITLCCLLWAHAGLEDALTAYEDRVLALIGEHRAVVVERVVNDTSIGSGSDSNPTEVQVYRFPDQASLDGYLADPRRAALAAERERVIRRTELFPVRRLPAT